MASTSKKVAGTKSILTPSMTLKGHGLYLRSISYFPDGQRMISGSYDKTTRQWDLKAGKEIKEARDICEEEVWAVAVSRDSRWVVTGGGDHDRPELKACEVKTGIVKKLRGHSQDITCVDISADNTLLASGSWDETTRIWNLDTGRLVAGPFESFDLVGAVRFSPDSRKLAVKSIVGKCLEVWDVQSQKLDLRKGEWKTGGHTHAPVFWTNKNILASFSFACTEDDDATTIYEFNASTLETIGAPFEGHTKIIVGLALSSDGALLASTSFDDTIKLWAFESRQLLASFDVQNPRVLILSPNSRQLAYTTYAEGAYKICICNIPLDVLAQAGTIARKKPALSDLLNSDATRRPAARHRGPPIPVIPMVQRPPPTIDLQQPIFVRLSKFLRFSPRTNAVRPGRNDEHHDPLDFSATLPLPRPLSGRTSTQGRSHMNSGENSRPLLTTRLPANPPTTFTARIHHLSSRWPVRGGLSQTPIVDVPLAQAKERNAAAGAPKKDKDIVPIEYIDPPSPNPDSQQPATAVQPGTGEHGGDRSCFCF
ncbi:WD40 repeat-like protein [Suillus weaverae]|nr:WD40 repeat-like protein [Suillus weaverae]